MKKRHLVFAPEGRDALRSACGRRVLDLGDNTTPDPAACDCLLCKRASAPFGENHAWAIPGYHYRVTARVED
jgi:ADP-ribose pyrophosphatase YjhB (NUDIX family)